MLKKVPYGIKVRVKGNDVTGYRAQLCISYSRFVPFLNIWSDISIRKNGVRQVVFASLREAQVVALKEYDQWISYAKFREDEDKQTKKVAKKVVWEHP